VPVLPGRLRVARESSTRRPTRRDAGVDWQRAQRVDPGGSRWFATPGAPESRPVGGAALPSGVALPHAAAGGRSVTLPTERTGSQAAPAPWTPPRWLIPWITRLQVFAYERSRGRFGARAGGMRHLLLRTVGRKSGRPITVCLPYWRDEQGRRVVVASFAGAPRNPAWYHNLADSQANPEVLVRDGARRFWCRCEIPKGEERDALWARLIVDRPFYADYQARTGRRIPLVRLVEVRELLE
jgi:deazaflavin-dependent oxidoreductase (nitroreductase family)